MELKENLAYDTVVSGDTQATTDPVYDTVLELGDTQATMDLKENPAYGTAVVVSGDTQAPYSITTTSNDSGYEN